MKKALFILVALLVALPLIAGGGGEKMAEAKYKIGIVFDIGGRGDQSFNDSAYNGMVMLAKESSKGTSRTTPARWTSARRSS